MPEHLIHFQNSHCKRYLRLLCCLAFKRHVFILHSISNVGFNDFLFPFDYAISINFQKQQCKAPRTFCLFTVICFAGLYTHAHTSLFIVQLSLMQKVH